MTIFQQEIYLADLVQSIFGSIDSCGGKLQVVGGDGRYDNHEELDARNAEQLMETLRDKTTTL